jgi:hypothetical protein
VSDSTHEPTAPAAKAVTRQAVLGLDRLERKMSYFATVIAILSSLVYVPRLLKATWYTFTAKPGKGNSCAAGYKLVAKLCQRTELTQPSHWWPLFGALVALGLFIGLFTWRNKRTGVIVFSMLLGLVSGLAGFLFLALGAWLLVRAFRLQRFGDATFKGSNMAARQRAQDKRNARAPRASRGARGTQVDSKAGPTASKRYTPKKPARR